MLMVINMSVHGRMARRASQGSSTTPMVISSGDKVQFNTVQNAAMDIPLQ